MTTMIALAIDGVSRQFGKVRALHDVSLEMSTGEVTCLVGQSGCGKSTLLRVIAGIETVDAGTVALDGRVVTGPGAFVEPEDRNVGFVFQDYALFPHLTARDNIGFGLRRMHRAEAAKRVEDIIARLGIGALAERFPHMLSGGEQQRIALARALAPQPHILLMDEPFSNLDRRLRDSIRAETMHLLKSLGTTAVIVTHDPEEALSLGDRVILMQSGHVVENGRGDDIYNHPTTPYGAEFFSRFNRIDGRRKADRLETPLGSFALPPSLNGAERALLYVRPQAITLADTGIAAEVIYCSRVGEIEEVRLKITGLDDPVLMHSSARSNVTAGDRVHIQVDDNRVIAFDAR